MSTKELIEAEISRLSEEELDQLYQLIKDFVQTKEQPKKQTLFEKLREIKIYAPVDFAENLDLYTSGEKIEGENLP